MKHATIKHFTHAPGAPRGWTPANGPCGALPIVFRKDAHGNDECVSAWKPSKEDIATLINGGYIMLSVVGWQPPVSMWVEDSTAADE